MGEQSNQTGQLVIDNAPTSGWILLLQVIGIAPTNDGYCSYKRWVLPLQMMGIASTIARYCSYK